MSTSAIGPSRSARARIVLAVILLSAGCGVGPARQSAEELAERYFHAVGSDDASPIFSLYDDAFYAATPRQEWRKTYSALRTKLGKPTEHSLATWQARSNVGAGGNGFFVTLVYNVKYEHATGTETFAIFIPATTQIAGISGHHFESDALLK